MRKSQAKEMFNQLEQQQLSKNGDNVNTYYTEIFKIIFSTQQQIIQEDASSNKQRWFTHLNDKGYSRLYDITTDILNQVLKKYHVQVINGNITSAEYEVFSNQLQQQLPFHIQQLKASLPQNHKLYQAIKKIEENIVSMEKWKDGQGQLALEKELNLIKEDDIPKYLAPLVENVRCYLSLIQKAMQPQLLMVHCTTI